LRCPRLPLYLGRKSCPLALPLKPQVIEAEWFEQALAEYDDQRVTAEQTLLSALPQMSSLHEMASVRAGRGGYRKQDLYWEDEIATALSPLHSNPRYDRPMHRARRQFGSRTEHYVRLDLPEGA